MKEIFDEYQNRAISLNPILTVIIIIRTNNVYDMVERIGYRAIYPKDENIEYLIVNDGSNSEDTLRIKNECEINGFSYLGLKTNNQVFNASRARNMGAIFARGKYIMHEDIDLIAYQSFYEELLKQIELQDLSIDQKQIITVPVAYLSKNASKDFFELDAGIRKQYYIDSYLKGFQENFEFFMPASSLVLINRYYYLMIGGYNERFINWGLEDLEFIYRCVKSANKFALPDRHQALFTSPEFSKQLEYKGWRTMFRLHGDLMFSQGIIMFHIHHDKDHQWRNKDSHSNNLKLFNDCTRRFDKEGHYLPPLPSNLNDRALVFGKGCFAYNRALIPHFGEMIVKGYEYFDGSTTSNIDILEFIKANEITRVIFTNPYANLQRQKIYSIIKEAKVPYYVVERGALRDSIFVDSDGFSCESSSYSEHLWDKEITINQREEAINYINFEKSTDESLENQPNRIGVKELNHRLGLASNQKVLFVPLQSRSDTTINYFAGDIESYDNFIELVRKVISKVDRNWVVLVKTHPLSKIQEDLPNAIFVDDYNIKDLLERCDTVLLINSGVGVLATLWGKKVLHCGQAFYRSDKLNRKVLSSDDVLNYLKSNIEPDQEDILKFTSYLINRFYSFGKMSTFTKDYTDKARLTITNKIDYYRVNIDEKRLFHKDKLTKIPTTAPIYDVFRSSLDSNKKIDSVVDVHKKNRRSDLSRENIVEKSLEANKDEYRSLKNSLVRKTRKLIKDPKKSIYDTVKKRTNFL